MAEAMDLTADAGTRKWPLPAPETLRSMSVREVFMRGLEPAPPVRGLLYCPRLVDAPRPAILHMHSGGYIFGAPEMNAVAHVDYAEKLGAVVLAVDYRLAPATRHPGPVEDCYAALAWLFAQADDLHIDTSRVIVSGESAGGGLAAALALMARDRGEYRLAFQHLIFPMLDDRTVTSPDGSAHAGEFVWTRALNRHAWTSLLGSPPGSDDISCYAAPARAATLTNLPPAYIACGSLDLFLEEDLDYARRLMRAGVPVELHIYPGAPHGFTSIPDARVSGQANRDSFEALQRALHRCA
jgi:triacylglycerol lipase